jgi:biotin synthase-like enzyme
MDSKDYASGHRAGTRSFNKAARAGRIDADDMEAMISEAQMVSDSMNWYKGFAIGLKDAVKKREMLDLKKKDFKAYRKKIEASRELPRTWNR